MVFWIHLVYNKKLCYDSDIENLKSMKERVGSIGMKRGKGW